MRCERNLTAPQLPASLEQPPRAVETAAHLLLVIEVEGTWTPSENTVGDGGDDVAAPKNSAADLGLPVVDPDEELRFLPVGMESDALRLT